MIRKTFLAVVISFLISALSAAAQVPQTDGGADMEPQDIVDIDPFAPDALDYLDTDVNGYFRLGGEAYEAGDYEKAARYYLAASRSNIDNSTILYNLACCYGLLGQPEAVARTLESAVIAGFADVGWIKQDTDFDKVRESEIFKSTLEGVETYVKEMNRPTGEIVPFEAGALLEGRVILPEGFDPEAKYDLLIGLHGGYGTADGFAGIYDTFEQPGFIYATLQGPYPVVYGGRIYYNWFSYDDPDTAKVDKQLLLAVDYVVNAVRELRAKYNIDMVYLFGFSMGTEVSYLTALKHPELFEGIIPLTGHIVERLVSEDEYKAASDLKVFIVHGESDRAEPFSNAERAYEILNDHGNNVELYKFEGEHVIPPDGLRAAVDWMGL